MIHIYKMKTKEVGVNLHGLRCEFQLIRNPQQFKSFKQMTFPKEIEVKKLFEYINMFSLRVFCFVLLFFGCEKLREREYNRNQN